MGQVVLLLAVMGSQNTYGQADHSHHHDIQATLVLNNGAKWQTDAPLRNNMETLRDAFKLRLNDIHSGTLAASEYALLGELTQKTVNNIIAECQLPSEADAQLHLVIAQMLEGASQLKEEQPAEVLGQSAHQIALAIINYGKFFDHPDWTGLK